MSEKQKTIKKPISVVGSGLHTGKDVTLTFNPAPANHGYKFQRVDLDEKPIVEADIDNVVDTARGTTIEKNEVRISTVEHVLAALSGLEIDNVLIELNCIETPIMDGSAKFFTEALLEAGIEELEEEKEYFDIEEIITFDDEENKIEMMILPDEKFKVTVMIDYNSPVVGRQHATLHDLSTFQDEYASSRTFVFLHELELLLNNNLIKGGDLSNAMVITDEPVPTSEVDRLAAIFKMDVVDVKTEGIINTELRHTNEPARHKLVDLIGDLSLVGVPIKGRVVATRPGHAANVKFAKKIKDYIKKEKQKRVKDVPVYDPSAKPVYDVNDIKNILPHRPPFLLVDKILELGEDSVIGLKNVTMNEPFFVGHFPAEPIMPGVLIVEAMAQAGGVFVLNTVPDPENYITLFLKMNDIKFRKQVVPGDTLIFRSKLISPIRRGLCEMKAEAFVGDTVVVEGILMAQIVKIKN